MLYIIGGISRSGKSIVAEKFHKKTNIPYLPLDSIVMGFTDGMPEYGVNDKQMPDEIARRIWRFVKPLCENLLSIGLDYAIEGEAILPEQVKELTGLHPGKIKACFIGYCEVSVEQKIEEVKTFSTLVNDWLLKEPEEVIRLHIENMVAYSRTIRESCRVTGFRYFDTSRDFIPVIGQAVRFLAK